MEEIKIIKEIFDKQPIDYGSDTKFHVSANGMCRRKLYMQMKGLYKEKHSTKTIRNFAIGNLFHMHVVKELIEKASASGFQVVATEVNIPEHKYVAGKIDVIISGAKSKDMIIIDVKSCGNWTLNKVRSGEIPENYQNQVQLYMHFTQIHRGYLLFFGKEKGDFEEFEVVYNEKKALELVNEIENFMINNVEKNIEPQRCNERTGWMKCECCWGEMNVGIGE